MSDLYPDLRKKLMNLTSRPRENYQDVMKLAQRSIAARLGSLSFKSYGELSEAIACIDSELEALLNETFSTPLESHYRIFEADTRKAMEPYVMLASRNLCATVLAELPREIRDMIYDYTIGEHADVYIIENKGQTGRRKFILLSRDATGNVRRDWESTRRYSDTYTGATLSQELKERWYEKATFHSDTHYSLVPEVLASDIWALGLEPHKLVSHITLFVDSFRWKFQTLLNQSAIGIIQDTLKAAARIDLRIKPCPNLIKYKEGYLDRTYTATDENFKQTCPVVCEWLAKGYKVRVIVDKRYERDEMKTTDGSGGYTDWKDWSEQWEQWAFRLKASRFVFKTRL